VKVSVVELTPGLMPGADPDLVKPLEKRLRARYEAILVGTKVTKAEALKEGIRVTFEGKNAPEPQVYDRVLVAVGRSPNGKAHTPACVDESPPRRLPDDGSCGTAHFTTAGAALAPAAPGISISKLNALAPHGGHAVGAVSSRDLQKRQPRPKQWEALPTPSGQDDLSSTPA